MLEVPVYNIEGEQIDDLTDFLRVMDDVAEKPLFLITARRGEETKFLLVKRGAREVAPPELAEDLGPAARPSEAPPEP